MRITSLALILLVVGVPVCACGGENGSAPSEVGGRGGESGDGDGDTNTNGDGDPGDGDGDGSGGKGDGDGDVVEPLPVDLDVHARVIGSSVDMGAYESAE